MPKKFSHVPNFTDYMKIVFNIVNSNLNPQRILDIPAGNGLLAMKLKESAHEVVCADINDERKEYVYVDMSEALPFHDDEFDTVICMEGVEHVIEPAYLISELCRICKSNGRIIISLPNIQNLYSRFQFMCTGTFYQFPPSLPEHVGKSEKIDLGHISSLSYVQLRYLFKHYGAKVSDISGDKYKRKFLLPFLSPFLLIGYIWLKMFNKRNLAGSPIKLPFGNESLFRFPLLFSRSLILVFEKDGQPV